jgi:hypothetical protein
MKPRFIVFGAPVIGRDEIDEVIETLCLRLQRGDGVRVRARRAFVLTTLRR